jgi:hypothetical protein
VNEDGLIYLGAALWLRDHGCGWVTEHVPEMVVPLATGLAEALREVHGQDAEAGQ